MEQQENFDAYSQSKTLFISQNNNSYDRNKNKSSQRYTDEKELCEKHGGRHLCIDCYDNPRGRN